MATFSTVSLMRETPDVVERFARYYLKHGAERMFIYYDGTAPATLRDLQLPGVELIDADDGFWVSLRGGRPETLEERQSATAHDGVARSGSDWLLVVDADEFVFGNRPLPVFLDAIPKGFDSVLIPVAEAAWGPGDDIDEPFGSTHFRTVWDHHRVWKALGRPMYGKIAEHMRLGVAAHPVGKQLLRGGRPYSWIRNHSAQQDGRGITFPTAKISPDLQGMYVGHFDAIGYRRWEQKWRQRFEGDTIAANMQARRESQMQMVADALAAGDDKARALFRTLYGLSRSQYLLISTLGYAFRRDIFAPGA